MAELNIDRQIQHWLALVDEDLRFAQLALANGHFRHAGFMAELGLEKMLKALVVQSTRTIPRKTHHLLRLAELAGLDLGV